jgi:hypothetical protein
MKLKINVRNESFTVEWHLDVAASHAKKQTMRKTLKLVGVQSYKLS